jgi:hypothetical protein
MSEENMNYEDDNLVTPQDEFSNGKFPNSRIVRLVQMDGYLQYHFEDGTSGSASSEEDVEYLTLKRDAQSN